jgi:hypothetical protein
MKSVRLSNLSEVMRREHEIVQREERRAGIDNKAK